MTMNKSVGKGYNHKLPETNLLKKLYFGRGMSCSEISEIYNVTVGAVKNKFNRYNIKLRTLGESQKLLSNYVNLSNKLVEFLDGLLLGDGSFVLSSRKKSARYKHSDKNKLYLIYLKKQLSNFNIESSKIYRDRKGYFHFHTKSYRDFVKLHKRWYIHGKKKIPFDLDITPTILKNWYIGDGSFKEGYNNTKKSERVMICTEFDINGRQSISKKLNELNIKNSIYSNGIYIKAENRIYFFKFMLSKDKNIPKCYRYKFPNEVKK